jgi:hypothetical protein
MRALAIVVLTCLAGHAPAVAQDASQKNQLIGTWKLKLADNVLPDGSRVHLYGPDPQGPHVRCRRSLLCANHERGSPQVRGE